MKELDPFKIMIAVIVFGSALYLAWFSYDQRQRSECQAKYNTDVARVVETRNAITDRERKAQVSFFLKLAEVGNNRQESSKIFRSYITQVKEFQRQRDQNPIPHLSERACD